MEFDGLIARHWDYDIVERSVRDFDDVYDYDYDYDYGFIFVFPL